MHYRRDRTWLHHHFWARQGVESSRVESSTLGSRSIILRTWTAKAACFGADKSQAKRHMVRSNATFEAPNTVRMWTYIGLQCTVPNVAPVSIRSFTSEQLTSSRVPVMTSHRTTSTVQFSRLFNKINLTLLLSISCFWVVSSSFGSNFLVKGMLHDYDRSQHQWCFEEIFYQVHSQYVMFEEFRSI